MAYSRFVIAPSINKKLIYIKSYKMNALIRSRHLELSKKRYLLSKVWEGKLATYINRGNLLSFKNIYIKNGIIHKKEIKIRLKFKWFDTSPEHARAFAFFYVLLCLAYSSADTSRQWGPNSPFNHCPVQTQRVKLCWCIF